MATSQRFWKSPLVLIGGVAVIVVLTVLFSKSSWKPGDTKLDAPDIFPVVQDQKGNYFLNNENGESTAFIPKGYTLEYTPDADAQYLVLKKGNRAYSYQTGSKEPHEIAGVQLKAGQRLVPYPSISEDNKFLIVLQDTTQGEGPQPITRRGAYFFDGLSNELSTASFWPKEECLVYDSQYQRYFTWLCGEGIGESIPLSVVKIDGTGKQEIISNTEFDEEVLGAVTVEHWGQSFVIMEKDSRNQEKIVVVDGHSQEVTQKIFTFTKDAQEQFRRSGSFPYSAAWVSDENMIVIGGDHYIHLLNVDRSDRITKVTTLPEREVYADNLYIIGHHLYYPAPEKSIHVVNLKTRAFERSMIFGTYGQDTFVTLYTGTKK